MRLRNKVLTFGMAPLAVLNLLTLLAVWAFLEHDLNDRRREAESSIQRWGTNLTRETRNQFESLLAQISTDAQVAARQWATEPGVADAYATALSGDIDDEASPQSQEARDKLRALLEDRLTRIGKEEGSDVRVHYHLPNSRSLVRLWRHGWQTKRDGKKLDVSDDISSFRHSLVRLNTGDHAPVRGIEVGRGGFAIRGICPVTDASGKHLGSCEVLRDFGQLLKPISRKGQQFCVYMDASQLDTATKLQDPEKYPLTPDGRYVRVYASDPKRCPDSSVTELMKKTEGTGFVTDTRDSGDTVVAAFPLTDVSNQTVGGVVLVRDLSAQTAQTRKQQEEAVTRLRKTAGTYCVALLLIALGLGTAATRAIGRTTSHLARCAEFATAIGEGDAIGQVREIDSSTIETVTMMSALNDMSKLLREREDAQTRLRTDLETVLSQVAELSDQVDSGANQISDASQSLSQGATESAASLEEITSSMTQMGSQTRTNAENATQANRLATSARDSAGAGTQHMQDLMGAMEEINESSQQISKIIKTIDDIAFQTNLLALNAAVEAARAGRHGKGFAVVAQEVRNLASRSARAAKETSDLIEASGAKVENGTQIASTTAEALNEIVDGVTKTTDLVGEIAAASNEQAQGIAQVNQGLQQIDCVTQQNTANAEETASAAEELSSQATVLRNLLSRFRQSKQSSPPPAQSRHDAQPTQAPPRQLRPASPGGWGGVPTRSAASAKTPNTLITWSDDLSVLVPKFDKQHQKLIDLINRLYAAMRAGKANDLLEETLTELTAYTKTHFGEEEAFMRVHKYPGLDQQLEQHQAFVAKIVDATERFKAGAPLGVEIMNFLKSWLLNHIRKEDHKYGEYFEAKGINMG